MYGDRFSSIYGQRFSEYLWEKCKTERSNVSVTGPGDKPGCVFINPDHPTKGVCVCVCVCACKGVCVHKGACVSVYTMLLSSF